MNNFGILFCDYFISIYFSIKKLSADLKEDYCSCYSKLTATSQIGYSVIEIPYEIL